jgi:flagellar biogenesis protein FliO
MKANEKTMAMGGLAGWLLRRLRGGGHRQPRLELVERIALAPRQSLTLVEAEGRRILVATSPEGAPAFFALDEQTMRPNGARLAVKRRRGMTPATARVSW